MTRTLAALAAASTVALAAPAAAAEPNYRIETPEDRTRRAAMRWETAFVVLAAADLAITVQCLEANECREVNPLAKKHSPAQMIAIKSALTLGHYIFVKRLAKDHPKAALRFAQVSVAWQGTVVGLNIRTRF